MNVHWYYALSLHFIVLMIERYIWIDSTLSCSFVYAHVLWQSAVVLPVWIPLANIGQNCQSAQSGNAEKANAILHITSSSKTHRYPNFDTPFHKVSVGSLLDHCLSEFLSLVNLIFPRSMVVMFVSDSILSQDFICHPMEMWLYYLITSSSRLLK